MTIVHPEISFTDERGSIIDVLDGVPMECVTVLTCTRGSVRGNHFHRHTVQYSYVLRGSFQFYSRTPGSDVNSVKIVAGDLVTCDPMDEHAFVALEDSQLLACAHGMRIGSDYEQDTYRLDQPLNTRKGLV